MMDGAERIQAPELSAALASIIEDEQRKGREGLASRVVARVRRELGGRQVYISLGAKVRADARNAAMRAEFNGGNHAELAAKYGLCIQTVYKILKRRDAA